MDVLRLWYEKYNSVFEFAKIKIYYSSTADYTQIDANILREAYIYCYKTDYSLEKARKIIALRPLHVWTMYKQHGYAAKDFAEIKLLEEAIKQVREVMQGKPNLLKKKEGRRLLHEQA